MQTVVGQIVCPESWMCNVDQNDNMRLNYKLNIIKKVSFSLSFGWHWYNLVQVTGSLLWTVYLLDLEKNGVNNKLGVNVCNKDLRMTTRWGFLVCDGIMSERGGRRERDRQSVGWRGVSTHWLSAVCEMCLRFPWFALSAILNTRLPLLTWICSLGWVYLWLCL